MNRLQKSFVFFVVLIALFAINPFDVKASDENNPPIITRVRQDDAKYLFKPLIIGLTPENSEVLIYINGTFDGTANINREQTGTDNFYYQVKSVLQEGTYTVSAITKNKTSLRLSVFSEIKTFNIESLNAPILIDPNENTITGNLKPFITGLSINNTYVHIFVDGQHNGKTGILNHISGTANFAYKPFLNLTPGWHTIWARSEDSFGRVSKASNVMNFKIEYPLPAPIVINTIVNKKSSIDQPLITGLTKNNTRIRIFIDRKLNGEFLASNNSSGTSNFAYKPFVKLKSGTHLIYATAVDKRGKESIWSNIIYYKVPSNEPAISRQAVSEEKNKDNTDTAEKNSSIKEKEEADTIQVNEENEIKEKASENENDKAINDILDTNKASGTGENGLINESNEQQSKLKLNLVIFIIFLFAVIGWIFWVNRELIKEKRDQNEKDKS